MPLQELYQLLIYPFACCAVLHISAKVRTSSGNAPPAHCYIPHLSGYGQVSKELKPETWTKQCTKQHKVSRTWNPTKGRTVSALGKNEASTRRKASTSKQFWSQEVLNLPCNSRGHQASGMVHFRQNLSSLAALFGTSSTYGQTILWETRMIWGNVLWRHIFVS